MWTGRAMGKLTPHLIRTMAGLFVVALAAVWVLRPPDAVPARIANGDCRHVAVRDTEGRGIVGIEDIALAQDGDTLVLSAHDRRDPAMPDGGLYALSLFGLGGGAAEARRISVTPGRSFRPHGFALSPDGRRLAVINRPAEGQVEVLTGPFEPRGWYPSGRVGHPRLCRANDLAFADPAGDGLAITIDRESCGLSPADLVPWARTGSVMLANGAGLTTTRRDLAFANGILDGVVAETRGQRLALPGAAPIDLPGGPDNITRAPDGRLIVAVHPKLVFNWFAQQGWRDRLPTRIVAVDPVRRSVEVLVDDVSGEVFSGATVALVAGGRLIAGSAMDHGLLVCEADAW